MCAQVLMLCSDPHNHPVLFHCSSGKDRTGLIAALIQSVCGVGEEEILDSYAASETYLAPVLQLIAEEDRKRGLSEEFDGTPRCVSPSCVMLTITGLSRGANLSRAQACYGEDV
jgi:protein-tyrosine phosphatase